MKRLIEFILVIILLIINAFAYGGLYAGFYTYGLQVPFSEIINFPTIPFVVFPCIFLLQCAWGSNKKKESYNVADFKAYEKMLSKWLEYLIYLFLLMFFNWIY